MGYTVRDPRYGPWSWPSPAKWPPTPPWSAAHNTGRVLDSSAAVVAPIRGVAEELTHDAEVRRVLVQAVLSSPEPLR